ncbi:AMP-binding protein [Nocardia sp. BMG51109]|uniref:AMP-binding protein n=1 Tax=Nocardia sp. BMG51109 TaxID=1056816 RepID=UPI0004630ED3|nr:AMP-binding protein [Nocardia sp. BMG51109]
MNLWQKLIADARSYDSCARFWVDNDYVSATWGDLVAEAQRTVPALRRLGVGPGSRIAVVLANGPGAARALAAGWMAGAAVASLPVRVAGTDAAAYAEQLRSICDHLEPVVLLADSATLAALPQPLHHTVPAYSFESLPADGTAADPTPPGDDDVAFIQYSSGSTGTPKGCMLTPRAIAAQLDMLAQLTAAEPGETGATWLPWSHDMGLFGGLLSGWWNDVTTYYSTPQRFLMSPRTWFEDIARYGAHYTAGSPTALQVAARVTALRAKHLPGSLGQLKAAIIGAERVHWEVLEDAVANLGRFGLRRQALMPAYGLAEGTLAVTATPMDEEPRFVAMDSVALAAGRLRRAAPDDPAATRVVSAGPVCRGMELIEPEPGGDRLAPIRFRSQSLATGYYGDPTRTAEHFVDGVFDTSDLGFVIDGHLYPVGRSDDMISVAGRNVYLREVEKAIEEANDLRFGCSTVVDARLPGRSRLTLLVETGGARVDHGAVARRAATAAMSAAALPLDECVFLRRNALPRTPSGKIQRHRCRQLLAEGGFAPVASVQLAEQTEAV